MSGERLELDVPPESDILDLKRSIEGGGEWHVPANCQQMLQGDNALTAHTTLQDEERIAALGTEDSAIVSLTMIVSLEKVFRELGSNNPDCRIDALQQLCQFGLQTDANVVGAVCDHILDNDNDNDGANVRSEAVKALGQITRKDNQLAIDAVLACLRDGHAQTRDNAVGALAKIVENGQLEALDFEFIESNWIIGFRDNNQEILSAKLDSNSFTLKARRLYDITIDAFAKGLAHLTNLTVLRLNLCGCYQLNVDELGKGLADLTNLTSLYLNFNGCEGIATVDEVGKGLADLVNLTTLNVNLAFCKQLTSVDEVGKGISHLAKLTKLDLNFNECRKLNSVDEVGKGLADLVHLNTLSLGFGGLSQTIVDEVGKSVIPQIARLQELIALTLDFSSSMATNMDKVGKGLAELRALTNLKLNFSYCYELTSVDEVGKGLADLTILRELNLNFARCIELATVDEVGKGIAELHNLTTLSLDLSGHTDSGSRITSVDEVGKGLSHLTRLEKLDMSLCDCFQLKSVDGVGKGLADLTNLTSLDLNFYGCDSLATVDEVGKGLANLHCLTELNLTFCGCIDLATIDAIGERLAGRELVDISELWQSLPWK